MMKRSTTRWLIVGVSAAALLGVATQRQYFQQPALPDDFAVGNGRIEATEVNVATKLAGRIAEVLVKEGDMVQRGQILARLDTNELQAQLEHAEANVEQARQEKAFAEATEN